MSLVALSVLALLAHGSGEQWRAESKGCPEPGAGYSQLVTIARLRDTALREPSVAYLPDGPVVVARAIPVPSPLHTAPDGLSPGALGMFREIHGGRWQRLRGPAGAFQFRAPSAAHAADGVVSVVWGEADTAMFQSSALWAAAWRNGAWSEAERLLAVSDSAALAWTQFMRSELVAVDQGRLLGLVPVHLYGAARARLLILERDSLLRWGARFASPPWQTIYAALGPIRGDTIVMAVVSPNPERGGGANAVSVIATGDRGTRFAAPLVLGQGGATPGYEPVMTQGPDGAWHLVWREVTDAGSVIRHWQQRDGVWTESQPLAGHPALHLATILRVLVDDCGAVHLVFNGLGREGRELWSASAVRGRWLGPRRELGGRAVGEPAFIRIRDGRVGVVIPVYEQREPRGAVKGSRLVMALMASTGLR